jgi:hypothetical protein
MENPPAFKSRAMPCRRRHCFSVGWVCVAVIVALQRDVLAVVLWGMPVAWIGVAVLSCRPQIFLLVPFLLFWALSGSFYCYVWPSIICPIELPPSASHLYATSGGLLTYYHAEVRFCAPVDDCLAVAVREQQRSAAELGGLPIPQPVQLDRAKGMWPQMVAYNTRRKWWLSFHSIQKGVWYPSSGSYRPNIWVDTDRGILYYHITD